MRAVKARIFLFKMITYDGKFFSVKDTLECGQIFRFRPYEKGYLVFSADKACYAYNEGDKAVIDCEKNDEEYFENFFDLARDYSRIYQSAAGCGDDFVAAAAECGKGIRILNQEKCETLLSFIISQNNRIPRIKGIIERTCDAYGKQKTFKEVDYRAFPAAGDLPRDDKTAYDKLGYGYRSEFIRGASESLFSGRLDLGDFCSLTTKDLKKSLMKIKGVGPKVADCVSLFAYHRTDAFPVDTWIEKVYAEDLGGKQKDRNKITAELEEKYGENSGYIQQYVFHYKRNNLT